MMTGITTWPHSPIPEPLVTRATHVDFMGGDSEWIGQHGYPSTEKLPPDFIYHELLTLDPDNPSDIVKMLRYGTTYPGVLDSLSVHLRNPIGERPRSEWLHRTEVEAIVICLQVMVRHWIAHVEGSSVGRPWIDARLLSGANVDDTAWRWWHSIINNGLKTHPPHVRLNWTLTDPGASTVEVGYTEHGIYSAVCIQLFNEVASGVIGQRCANEPCGRYFTRQRGRAQAGQNRMTGVLYCSANCAQAQYQRELRRRRRAVK